MADPLSPETATFAFADPASGAWGAGWIGADEATALVVGRGESYAPLRGSARRGGDQDEWHIDVDGGQLVVGQASVAGVDQLCQVTGGLTLAGEELEIDSPGWRQLRRPAAEGDWAAVRQVVAWFAPDDGLALTALRPRKARDHASDFVHGEILGDEAAVVEDPRLSTTYGSDGNPRRAGLELWIGSRDSEDLHAVRAAGEAAGPQATLRDEGLTLAARPFHWRSRGKEGTGVYLLGSRA